MPGTAGHVDGDRQHDDPEDEAFAYFQGVKSTGAGGRSSLLAISSGLFGLTTPPMSIVPTAAESR